MLALGAAAAAAAAYVPIAMATRKQHLAAWLLVGSLNELKLARVAHLAGVLRSPHGKQQLPYS
jgi:hypothetical protein